MSVNRAKPLRAVYSSAGLVFGAAFGAYLGVALSEIQGSIDWFALAVLLTTSYFFAAATFRFQEAFEKRNAQELYVYPIGAVVAAALAIFAARCLAIDWLIVCTIFVTWLFCVTLELTVVRLVEKPETENE